MSTLVVMIENYSK